MTRTIEVECSACQGEGRDIRYGITYEPGCGHPHMGEVDHGLCPVCHGACVVEEVCLHLRLESRGDDRRGRQTAKAECFGRKPPFRENGGKRTCPPYRAL